MLASDYVLQAAASLLEKVRDGELRLDRTIEVSVTNTSEKRKIMRRLVPNLQTLQHLLLENHRDFRIAISRRYTTHQRRTAWRRLVRRRNRAVRLIEELNLRTQRLQPLFDNAGGNRRSHDGTVAADPRSQPPRCRWPGGRSANCGPSCVT